MRAALLLAAARVNADVIAPRMTARVAKRRAAAARTPSALVGRKVLLGWPECAADPALRLHAVKIGRRGDWLE